MVKLLIKIWPALIPIVICAVWYFFIHKRKKGDRLREWEVRLWTWVAISSVVIAIITMLFFALTVESNKDMEYFPSRLEDGKLVKGHMEPKKLIKEVNTPQE